MNGWQRLWLIGCVLLALAVSNVAMDYWPSSETDKMVHDGFVKSNELSLAIIKTAMEYPESSPGVISDKYNIDQINYTISQEEERYRNAVHSLWSRQVACALMFSAIWIVLCGVLYLLGLIGGWVMKGFRPKAV